MMEIPKWRIVMGIFLIALLTGCATTRGVENRLDTVSDMQIERYLGRWYEIARFQSSFERNLVAVTAEYSLRDDGRIKVVNSGFNKTFDGRKSKITGVAWAASPEEPGYLKVQFFWPFTEENGFDTSKLYIVPQKQREAAVQP